MSEGGHSITGLRQIVALKSHKGLSVNLSTAFPNFPSVTLPLVFLILQRYCVGCFITGDGSYVTAKKKIMLSQFISIISIIL
jgi:hypothetical protein